MAGTKIQAVERPVGDVFSDEYEFTIPRYQRPYAWTTEEAGEMLDDLVRASGADPSDAPDPYFLGSIVVVKREDQALAEVVDGQQRLTTLTILISALREHVETEYVASLDKRLFQAGDALMKKAAQPRLRIRDRDRAFFEQHIQDHAGIHDVMTLHIADLPESQQNAAANAQHFLRILASLGRTRCEELATYIATSTYLVVVSTQEFESAFRIFTVLNERGLDLTHSDILKSEIIGAIPDEAQDTYTERWEQEEEDLGRNDFADLFGHIRMIYAKTRARKTILEEFRTSVLANFPDKRSFIDDALVPFSDAFEITTRADYVSAVEPGRVNEILGWLNLIDNSDWIPPAIWFASRPNVASSELADFLTGLERLAASMFVRRSDVNKRVERYGRLLESMQSGSDLDAPDSPLQLSEEEKTKTIERLRGEIYLSTRTRLYILLRLDSALADGGATYERPLITVEHVLPQNPAANSDWLTTFSEEERLIWVHRLANLVLLGRRKNSEAQNFEFATKKEKYFVAGNKAAPFALTTQVVNCATWTPDLLVKRQEMLVGKLADLWRLG